LFYSSVPAEVVTIAITDYVSLHSLWCLMNRKVKSFKQRFYWNKVQSTMSSYRRSTCWLSAL